jgi:isoleucyl-tRNA synthetase
MQMLIRQLNVVMSSTFSKKSVPSLLPLSHLLTSATKILDTYLSVLAPMAPHLAEEIHHFANGGLKDPIAGNVGAGSVFEKGWAKVDEEWRDAEVKVEMEGLLVVRDQVLELLEQARRVKHVLLSFLSPCGLGLMNGVRLIGSSTEAEVLISNPTPLISKHRTSPLPLPPPSLTPSTVELLKTLFIVSNVSFETVPSPVWEFSTKETGMSLKIVPSRATKCPRCWSHTKVIEEELCGRCTGALSGEGSSI